MTRQVTLFTLAGFIVGSSLVYLWRTRFSAEAIADQLSERMRKFLDLTPAQMKYIEKVNLKYAYRGKDIMMSALGWDKRKEAMKLLIEEHRLAIKPALSPTQFIRYSSWLEKYSGKQSLLGE